MLTNETTSKLHEMHLGAMAEAFTAQMNDSQYTGLSFEDRFSMLVDAEWTRRKSNRLHSYLAYVGIIANHNCYKTKYNVPLPDLFVEIATASGVGAQRVQAEVPQVQAAHYE